MAPLWFAKGLGLGLSIAAPVGPIGVLCIRTSLTQGPRRGLAVGLGAATADAFYGAVAAFGLTAISGFMVGERLWLQIYGGVFLLYLGIKGWRSGGGPSRGGARGPHALFDVESGTAGVSAPGYSVSALYASSVGLTLTNPLTILSFVAIFAGMNLASAPDRWTALALVAGVFSGSALWWMILSSTSNYIGKVLGARAASLIARASAVILLAFGAVALASAAWIAWA
ncbi:MAG TPA: LysE family transporter [Opitutaceae bacterium]|jgi:threonine/homoserine/homoserine lactone efflux protein